jgi:hypothetical protein
MGNILSKLIFFGLFSSVSAMAENAELRHSDEVRRAQPGNYAKGWTDGLTYCADDQMDLTGSAFLRTTKAAGHERLKAYFGYADQLGRPLGPPWIPEGTEPPTEGKCDVESLSQAAQMFHELADKRVALLANTSALACEGEEKTPEERDQIARNVAAEIAEFEPSLTKSLHAIRAQASPRVRALITGAKILNEKSEDGFTRCESHFWWEYGNLESLSCQLFVMKLRVEFLQRSQAIGDRLTYQCYNDKPPPKIEPGGSSVHLNQSDITGIGTH